MLVYKRFRKWFFSAFRARRDSLAGVDRRRSPLAMSAPSPAKSPAVARLESYPARGAHSAEELRARMSRAAELNAAAVAARADRASRDWQPPIGNRMSG